MKVAVVKASEYNEQIIEHAVNEAINLIGGWSKYIQKGDKVGSIINVGV